MTKKIFAWMLASEGKAAKRLDPYYEKAIANADIAGKDVLEVGAGAGGNLPFYKKAKSVVLVEPNVYTHKYIQKKIQQFGASNVQIVTSNAEQLPFPDSSFDTVVTAFVLCSVQDVDQTLHEIKRVLRPGGQYAFLEHIAAEQGWAKHIQKILRPFWAKIADGCDCHRDIVTPIQSAGFSALKTKKDYDVPGLFIKPFLTGTAEK